MEHLFELLKSNVDAANAIGALASAAAAVLALVVSAISVGISVWAYRSQHMHNQLSVRPLPEITVADYENSLRVKLRNNGIGPLIVKSVAVSDGTNTRSSVVDWMPPLPSHRPWTNFSHALEDRTLQPGSEIVLLELTEYAGESSFHQIRDRVRLALAVLTVTVEHTDIYNTAMPPRKKSLSWFGRSQ